MKLFRRISLALVGALLLLSIILVINAFRFTSKQLQVPLIKPAHFQADSLAAHLSGAIRIQTVSRQDWSQVDTSQFLHLHAYLKRLYPLTFSKLQVESIGYSLLLTWEGTDSALKPILLMAHQDVVPIAPGTEKDWTYPPFAGRVDSGYIWGRGTMDDKCGIIGILESTERLLMDGFKPRRSILLAFGHDEEIGGHSGNEKIAAMLRARGVRLEFVLDEGGLIGINLMPGIDKPIALIGISEKGYLTVELTAMGKPGHSSTPPKRASTYALARAISRIEDHPFQAHYGGVVAQMFDYIGPEMPFWMKLVFANGWLLTPVIKQQLLAQPSTAALVRTTCVPTILQAGTKENVVPGDARAIINLRLLPGDSSGWILRRLREVVDDSTVKILPAGDSRQEASPISPVDAPSFILLQKVIRGLHPDYVVSPFLMLGASDSRHYASISQNVYRYLHTPIRSPDIARFHGTNERIGVEDFRAMTAFFHRIIIEGSK
jgi:carboxypeptidase PM20D1